MSFHASFILQQSPQTQPILLCWYYNQCIKTMIITIIHACIAFPSLQKSYHTPYLIELSQEPNTTLLSTQGTLSPRKGESLIPCHGTINRQRWSPESYSGALSVKLQRLLCQVSLQNGNRSRTKPRFINSWMVFAHFGHNLVLSHDTYIWGNGGRGEQWWLQNKIHSKWE